MTWLQLAVMCAVIIGVQIVHAKIVNRRVRDARREVHDEWMEWFRNYLRRQRI